MLGGQWVQLWDFWGGIGGEGAGWMARGLIRMGRLQFIVRGKART
jgi:hypothetical protein